MPKEISEPATVAIKTGEFEDAGRFHTGEGKATTYKLDDGSHTLGLENFRVTNGPDLHALLSPGTSFEAGY